MLRFQPCYFFASRQGVGYATLLYHASQHFSTEFQNGRNLVLMTPNLPTNAGCKPMLTIFLKDVYSVLLMPVWAKMGRWFDENVRIMSAFFAKAKAERACCFADRRLACFAKSSTLVI